MDGEDELLTLVQAAKESGYSPESLRLFAAKGKIDGAKQYGRQWLIHRTALRRFLSQHHPTTGRPRGSRNRPAE